MSLLYDGNWVVVVHAAFACQLASVLVHEPALGVVRRWLELETGDLGHGAADDVKEVAGVETDASGVDLRRYGNGKHFLVEFVNEPT